MNLDSTIFWIASFAGVFAIYAGFLGFSRWCLNSPAVAERKLRQLRPGMSEAEVRSLLGQPRRERLLHNQPEWCYGHRLKQHILILHFSEKRVLTQFTHHSRYSVERNELLKTQ